MDDRYLYLCVNACCVLVPFLFSFHPAIRFYRLWKVFIPVTLVVAAFFIVWDIIFTRLGVWSFNDRYVLGYYLFNLPLEEVLFFICIPYACMFTFYCMHKFTSLRSSVGLYRFTIALAVFFCAVAVAFAPRLYTSVTLLLLSALLFYCGYKKVSFLPTFYLSFAIILIPFFISNGILTGMWSSEATVRYNNLHNLNIRLGTIPVEDTFYGMLLQLANAVGLVYFSRRQNIAFTQPAV
ncbi:MAG: lycopene cyclase domain-containing protein [Bacteroidota bacterium]